MRFYGTNNPRLALGRKGATGSDVINFRKKAAVVNVDSIWKVAAPKIGTLEISANAHLVD
jgi:hypothetical protein